MEVLGSVLPIVVYMLLIVLLVVTIILAIKLIITIDKINYLVSDLQEKVSSLNSIFQIVKLAGDKVNYVTEKAFKTAKGLLSKVIDNFLRKEDENE